MKLFMPMISKVSDMMLVKKWGFIKTTIEFALQHPELKNQILKYLADLLENQLSKKM